MLEVRNYVDGKWCDTTSGKRIERRNPANIDQLVGTCPDSGREEAKLAIEAAQRAFPGWRDTLAPKRALILKKAIDLMRARLDLLARDLTAEQGKPYKESVAEIVRGLEEAEHMVGEGTRIEGRHIPSSRPGTVCYTTREPIGVVAGITPWNYPFIAPLRKIAPALVFGTPIVLKPATLAPYCLARMVQCLSDAELPPGVVNLVTGSGATVGAELAENPLVRGITFTGSTEVGADIAKAAAGHYAKLQLEMGGKNPCVVFRGADIEKAAPEITAGALTCAGQRCTSISRVIAHKSLAEPLVKLLKKHMGNIVVGDGMSDATTMGPLVTDEHLNNVLGYVQKGVKEGATIALGGSRLTGKNYDRGWYMEPTLMTGVTPHSTLAKEEVFGPLLSVIEFETFDEALAIANSVAYGLSACCYTPRVDEALKFVKQVQAGMTQVNMPTYCDAHAPFGGVKLSGHGAFSLAYTCVDFFMNQKAVYIQG